MSQRIRGKECTIQVVVDGDLKGGTFAKVTEFTLTPRTEIVETPFLGEIEDDLDIIHKGYDFSFQTQSQDSKAIKLLLAIVNRERARAPRTPRSTWWSRSSIAPSRSRRRPSSWSPAS
jgi:hypothetical protein